MKFCLLQGAFSPQMGALARELSMNGHEVHKINFCMGDYLFSYPRSKSVQYINFRHPHELWNKHFESLCEQNGYDCIVMHGDCHYYHNIAFEIAKKKNITVFVTEEGYFRPNYITFEQGGVNANSPLMEISPESMPEENREFDSDLENINPTFPERTLYCTIYYLANTIFNPIWFGDYKHRRKAGTFSELANWARTLLCKLSYNSKNRLIEKNLLNHHKKKFFLVPLQLKGDSQITCHSDYNQIEDFIVDIIKNFNEFAEKDTQLVFKHHPYCLGFSDYSKNISEAAKSYKISDRVFYLKGGNLASLLESSMGVININSTTGIKSISKGTPTLVLGKAIYNKQGIAAQQSLEHFLQAPEEPDASISNPFFKFLRRETQVNGSLYSHFSKTAKKLVKILEKELKREA